MLLLSERLIAKKNDLVREQSGSNVSHLLFCH
jgi:hypothetical protein